MKILGTTIPTANMNYNISVDVLTVAETIEKLKGKTFSNITTPNENIIQVACMKEPIDLTQVPLEQRAYQVMPNDTSFIRITDGTAADVIKLLIEEQPKLVIELDEYLNGFKDIGFPMQTIIEFQLTQLQESELPALIPHCNYMGPNSSFYYVKITDKQQALTSLKTYHGASAQRIERKNVLDLLQLIADKAGLGKRETEFYIALDLGTHEILIQKPHDYINLDEDPSISDIVKTDDDLWYSNTYFIIDKETKLTMAAQHISEFYDVINSMLYQSSLTMDILTNPGTVPVLNDGTDDLVPAPIAETEVTPLVPKSE